MNKPFLRPLLLAGSLLLALPAHALSLDQLGHLHGLAFDPARSESLLVAAHSGLYRVAPDGAAERLTSRSDDFMTLAAVPGDPRTLYASGHPPAGGNLGLLRSSDGGNSWTHWADGHQGPADYHVLAFRPDAPATMFGVHDGLQVSHDAGRTWQPVAAAPERLIAMAAAPGSDGPLFAATEGGLLTSNDGGISWRPATLRREPASLVHATGDGTLYAFTLGQGLLAASDGSRGFKPLYNGFGAHYPLRMAVADADPRRLALLTHASALFTSRDGGQSWQRYGLPPVATGSPAAQGAALYAEYCQACHGAQGVGQAAGSPGAPADRNQLAPSLDGAMHAWHHADGQLAETIREGGIARGGRMPPWKNLLSDADVTALVDYIKSLWGERERACQGARHMNCDWTPGG